MGIGLLNVSTVDGHWESVQFSCFDFGMKAVPLVPAPVPQLSNFCIYCQGNLSVLPLFWL